MSNEQPVFPLRVVYYENGQVDGETEVTEFEHLFTDIEDFDTNEDGQVFDALGRPVRLRVKIWEPTWTLELM